VELGLNGSRFRLHTPDGDATVDLRLPGRFNVLNAVAAGAVGWSMGVPVDEIARSLGSVPPAFGRGEVIDLGDTQLTLLLAKNPTGLDEIARLVAGDLDVLLNADDLDGRDVAWVWDADLEELAPSLGRVTCGGTRAAEAAMRLAYAGVARDRIEVVPDVVDAVRQAAANTGPSLPVVANYTAMLDLREGLAEAGHAERYWR
jgi:UDP-N-acetylmuramyl tripeptide synthase